MKKKVLYEKKKNLNKEATINNTSAKALKD